MPRQFVLVINDMDPTETKYSLVHGFGEDAEAATRFAALISHTLGVKCHVMTSVHAMRVGARLVERHRINVTREEDKKG